MCKLLHSYSAENLHPHLSCSIPSIPFSAPPLAASPAQSTTELRSCKSASKGSHTYTVLSASRCVHKEMQGHKHLFDWPVTFTKVKLMVADCTLAKCSEEHVNHKK